MQCEWDEAKNASNLIKHGVAFDLMAKFDWRLSLCLDVQFHDGEERELWVGPAINKLLAVVTVEKVHDILRIISLRRATNAEIARWRGEFQND